MATEDMSLDEAREVLGGFSEVNLDEVSPEVIKVALREFVEDRTAPAGYRVVIEHKEIQTFVPMFLFNRMLANKNRVQKLRRQWQARAEREEENTEEETFDLLAEEHLNLAKLTDDMFKDILHRTDPAVLWQATEVLAVWRLTPGEESMTLKRLILGLGLQGTIGLFTRFFGGMLLQKQHNL